MATKLCDIGTNRGESFAEIAEWTVERNILRSPDGMITLRRNLVNSGLELIEEEAITENVVRAIGEEEATKMKRIKQLVPKKFQKLFKEFAGVKGSQIHASLSNGELVYHRFVLRKP